MFEVHSHSQAEVLEAGRIVLDRLELRPEERIKPALASVQVITNVDPYQAQLINRFRRGSMLVPGQTLCWCWRWPRPPTSTTPPTRRRRARRSRYVHISGLGRFGRMWLSGTESEILQARDAAVNALEALDGIEGR